MNAFHSAQKWISNKKSDSFYFSSVFIVFKKNTFSSKTNFFGRCLRRNCWCKIILSYFFVWIFIFLTKTRPFITENWLNQQKFCMKKIKWSEINVAFDLEFEFCWTKYKKHYIFLYSSVLKFSNKLCVPWRLWTKTVTK